MRKIKEEWENQRNLFLFIYRQRIRIYQNLHYYFFTNPQENVEKQWLKGGNFPLVLLDIREELILITAHS